MVLWSVGAGITRFLVLGDFSRFASVRDRKPDEMGLDFTPKAAKGFPLGLVQNRTGRIFSPTSFRQYCGK
jgi:hypothetical protein